MLLVAVLMASAAHAESRPLPPPPSASLDEIAEWAKEEGDHLKNLFPRKQAKTDTPTRFGTLIDKSCRESRPYGHFEAWKERVEKLIAFAVTQTERCRQVYSFPVLSDVVSIIRRLRITCRGNEVIAGIGAEVL